MAILDDLSGFEFEDLMEDVFRNLGYENVRQAAKTADEGRDVVMEEVVDGTRRAIVVECKHTATVGRPVIQKLHSAIATFDFAGPKRGIVVTTGRFTTPAREYAASLQENGDPYPIRLLDGTDFREIADDIGLDLYNGRIEILCDEALRPYDHATDATAPVTAAFRDIENIDATALPDPHSAVAFRPVVTITAKTDAVFETSVGVVHRINDRTQFVVNADRGNPSVAPAGVTELIQENRHATVPVDDDRFDSVFGSVTKHRFGQTQTEYKEWAVETLQARKTTTVKYTGGNNVTYTKTCEPKRSDISVQSIDAVYLPEIRHTTDLREYSYPLEYYAAGPSRVTLTDGIHDCVHCEATGNEDYTYCDNCGAIACSTHIKTERLEEEPVCTGCAVTERFALNSKYFYDTANRDAFRDQYAAMPFHEKALENKPLVGGALIVTTLLFGVLLVSAGII